MRPEPSYLTEWTPEEIHWLIANGIKMTGLPAFAPALRSGGNRDTDGIRNIAS